MRAVPALPVLASLALWRFAGAVDHARHAQITPPPSVANLVPRQEDKCIPNYTPCADGLGCCEEGAPCTTLDNGNPGCATQCTGDVEICPDGGCCDEGGTCIMSEGNYFCSLDTGLPSISIPPFTNLFPTMTDDSSFPSSSAPAGGSSVPGGGQSPSDSGPLFPTPTETGGPSVIPPPVEGTSEPAPSESSNPTPSMPNSEGSSTAQGGNQETSASGPPAVYTGSASRVDVPFMSWLALLAGAFF